MALPPFSSSSALSTVNSAITNPRSINDWAKSNFPAAPKQQSDSTWYRADTISWQNWNQFFPIQLMVVDNNNGVFSQRISDGNWAFTFPVGLESLQISEPFAAVNSITLGGDVTEYNGAPVRNITISGTVGVLFGRDPGPKSPGVSFLNSVFAGTIANAVNTAQAGQSIANLGLPSAMETNIIQNSSFTNVTDKALVTGYAQMRLLQYFFESFNELLKTQTGRNSRLALAIWKQEAVYLVTPLDFTLTQSISSPLEYVFSIQLRATKRVQLTSSSVGAIRPYVPVQTSPSKLARLMNTIQAVRNTLQSAKSTILAVGGDLDATLFTPLRELTLLAKDGLSVPFAVADMANNVINSMKSAILDLASTQNAILTFRTNIQRAFGSVTKNADTISFNLTQLAAQQSSTTDQIAALEADPANNPFLDPTSNYDFFSGVDIGSLHLSPNVLSAVAAERQRIRNLTRLDFQNKLNAIQNLSDNYANLLGISTNTYNSTFAIKSPQNTLVSKATDDDYNILYALNSVIIELNRLVVSTTTNTDTILDTITTVAGMANASGIAFIIPTSKYPVPFPYGATIESLAAQYLGDPDRAIEIITLNGLQSPYVDEEGFSMPLLSNGVGNNLFVTDSSQLFAGQPVWISSTTTNRLATRISGIRVLNNQSMITVQDDVSLFTTQAQATLQAYLPNTVNSQQTIYIPSQDQPPQNDLVLRNVPGINQYDPLLQIGGIDLLLTPGGDLVLSNTGDTKWAVGLTNLIQSTKLAIQTPLGTLNRHPTYGLGLQPGQSLADLNAAQVAQAAQSLIQNNPSFNGVLASEVTLTGPVANLNLALSIAGTTKQILPLAVQVNR